ncbi:MAG: hypothetical protein V1936_00190 [Patescibacteria group bacterium]
MTVESIRTEYENEVSRFQGILRQGGQAAREIINTIRSQIKLIGNPESADQQWYLAELKQLLESHADD